ncbi:NAD(P)/FAD-dependent oxidoreductase [Pedobacter agri]|uniref:NADH:ubiquinone reductase (non-electrogenic) n=2 Tax=Pedobacter agri TaxID=454586 RepID=A0A9X3D9X2_9SPHI|nr:NAD(P)/FAD-dependent oxidoreductase [Pedobacter agri]MCX3263315.1 NAD(P)/FAD-dependent oxidoreductase [Pedobacter agri]
MKKVVIIGGGFAGLNIAKKLSKSSSHQVTLVDQHNYHFFPPLLYQVATAFIEPSNISYPFRKLFQEKGIRFFMGEFQELLPEQKKIVTSSGSLDYDVLVLAMGAETNYFGNEEISKNALPMKSIEDAVEMRNHILLQLEKAVRAESAAEKTRLSNIVIAGGGPTGVELAGMMAEMGRNILTKDYPEANFRLGKIYLVDGLKTLLAPMSQKSQNEAIKVLKNLGVEILLDRLVQGYDGKEVSLSDGSKIEAATLIWASGVMARAVEGVPKDAVGKGRRILVDAHNKVNGLDDVYAIGDQCLQLSDVKFANGHPQLAQVAIQQGDLLGENLINIAQGKTMEPFKYNDKGSMAIIAKFKAVVDLPKGFFKGFFAWLVWLFIHIIPIAGFRNKAKLAFNWLWSFITNDPTLRLIIRPDKKE